MKRVPLQSITVIRKSQACVPAIGEPFDFTDEEVEQIEKMNPDALGTMAVVDVAKAEKAAHKGKGSDAL